MSRARLFAAAAAIALVALMLSACSAVPEPGGRPAAAGSADSSTTPAAREKTALAWVRASLPSTATAAIVRESSTWIGRKSEGIFFVVRVTSAAEVTEFYFEKGSGRLDAVAIKSASREPRVFDRMTVPRGTDLARLTAQLRNAGGQP